MSSHWGERRRRVKSDDELPLVTEIIESNSITRVIWPKRVCHLCNSANLVVYGKLESDPRWRYVRCEHGHKMLVCEK